MNNANTTEADTDRALRWAELAALSREAARLQAIEAMRYNGNGPECLPHLACGGCGCDECVGGAVRCGGCVHRVAVTTVEDGTAEGMPICGWCREEDEKAGARQTACRALAPGRRCADYWNRYCATCDGRRAAEDAACIAASERGAA